jgi:hypothetical protein
MATPLFSFTTLNGSDPAGHDSINVLIKSIEDQLASVSSGLSTGADTPGSVTTGQVLRWSGTTYANALVNAASLDTGAVIEAKIASSAVTETKIADSAVTSAKIANDTIVNADINSSAAIVDTKLATISTAGKVANSATTAASANGNNTIVQRDASGNFSADTITAGLSGTATSATNIVGGSAGSVPYQTGTSATGMLGAGSDGHVLTYNTATTAPVWQAISSGSVTLAGDVTGAANANSISSTYPGHTVLTTTQKNALTGVTTGTMVYDSTLGLLQAWNGSSWVAPQAVQSAPTASAVRTSSTSITSNAAITYQSAGWDTNGIWSAASPTRLTAQIAGLYYVYFQVRFSTTATGNMAVRIYAENVSAPTTNSIQNTVVITGGTMVANLSTVFPMEVGDYITTNLGWNSGTTTIEGNPSIYNANQTRMGMFYIGKFF